MKTTTEIVPPLTLATPLVRPLALRIAGLSLRVPGSTPTRWWIMLGVILLTVGLFALAVRHAVLQGREAFKSIAGDCAPSIIAAQHIRTSLADFDANLTNQLLCAPGSPDMAAAVKNALSRRHEFTESLLQAAANITFGDAERQPITTMANEIGAYEAAMSRARALQEKGDLPGALTTSREASRQMHAAILPAAVALDQVNSQVLDHTYDAQQARSLGAFCWLGTTGLLCLAVLAAAQWSLWQTTRRRINPGLLLGTVLTLGLTLYGTAGGVQASRQLKVATKDAFDSVRYLWKARAVAYDANGAETRWLYDRAQAPAHAREFFDEAAQVGKAPAGVGMQEIAAAALANPARPLPEGFKGLLAQELGNITFTGELAAAAEAVRTFGDYLDVDKEIRRLEDAGRHQEAVRLCLSYAPGGSNAAFSRFDAALDKVLGINVDAFEQSARQGMDNLTPFNWVIPGFSVLTAFSVCAGFWPRIREYAD